MGEMHRERTGPGTYHPPRRPTAPDEDCGGRHTILGASPYRYLAGAIIQRQKTLRQAMQPRILSMSGIGYFIGKAVQLIRADEPDRKITEHLGGDFVRTFSFRTLTKPADDHQL